MLLARASRRNSCRSCPGWPLPQKAQVLDLLDANAEPQVIQAVSDEDNIVHLAAIEALGRIGSAASVPILLKNGCRWNQSQSIDSKHGFSQNFPEAGHSRA